MGYLFRDGTVNLNEVDLWAPLRGPSLIPDTAWAVNGNLSQEECSRDGLGPIKVSAKEVKSS